jgi:predicted Zn-dependent protease
MMISFIEILPIVGLVVGLYILVRPPEWWQKIQKLKFENKFGRVSRPDEHLDYVEHVGRRIEVAAGFRSGQSKFGILESKEINAFADEASSIFVTQGTLKLVSGDEHSLAAILAHELAHISAGHHEIQKRDKMKFMLLGHLISVGGWMTKLLGSFVTRAGAARYSQEQELEADRLAVSYLSLASG